MRELSSRFLKTAILLFGSPLLAQTGNTPFWAGYDLPAPIYVAPGSVINLFVQGVASTLTGPVAATSFPLPFSLAGISVALNQVVGLSGGPSSVAVPVLAVRPISTCFTPPEYGAAATCRSYAAITVQIPFEIQTKNGGILSWLVVSENGVGGGAIEIDPYLDQVHALAITHADGTAVDRLHPAGSGEVLVMWALGMGATTPSVASGQATPLPAPVVRVAGLNFDYRPNAPPSRPLDPRTQPQPVFAGLSPGYAGLYQVNFVVPPPPLGTPGCNVFQATDPGGVATNLTVSVIGAASFDGAGVCVDVSGTSSSASAPDQLKQHAR